MEIFATKVYERAIRKMITPASRKEMEATIATDPTGGSVISGTGGIRKIRWAGSGRGKRGGIRTIYFYHAGPQSIYLLTAYAKSAQEDLSPSDKKHGPSWLQPSRKRNNDYDKQTHSTWQ